MATVCYRVPYTAVEWNRVRTLFRSDDLEELEECLAILSMWYSRMSNKIPVALSMSDLLIRLAIAELRITNDSNQWMKMEELKMQYCIAIIRSVHFEFDRKQPTSAYGLEIDFLEASTIQ
ncbi:hypothetical protein KIN20_009242 [Parelaphostrongylus tenuis]|uniref:Uncharacterized protein n=1 Tax=Parelaphostrongylus tenuis TaxID=148309 RepID=A0AAD5M986_PARTN|nr:hypothetical protein KIN20_009242 [Parelaphostrongylus tenuis]